MTSKGKTRERIEERLSKVRLFAEMSCDEDERIVHLGHSRFVIRGIV